MTDDTPTPTPLTEDDVRNVARQVFAEEFAAQFAQLAVALATDAEVTV